MIPKVVIIDDEPWTRGVINKLANWEELGLEVVGEATDGETGLELIHRVLPDIVITDVKMPRISGIELVQRLRKEGFQIPILIISGYNDFEYVRSALKLGVTDYLLKPIKAQELNQQLQHCVELLKQENAPKPSLALKAGFFADGWEDQYYQIRRDLEVALQLGNREKVAQQFDHLLQVIEEHDGKQISSPAMIGVYYSLLAPLQKFIETMGSSKSEIFAGKNTSFVFSFDNTLQQMLDYVQDLYLAAMEQIEKQQQQRARLDISAVCRYVQENYTDGVTLEQTADIFHVSKEYLSKAFKAQQGEGFSEYVTSLRMERAYELITQYDAPLKEVGFMVGYYDLAHFYKTFKKYFGKTPGEIKNRLKNDNETTP